MNKMQMIRSWRAIVSNSALSKSKKLYPKKKKNPSTQKYKKSKPTFVVSSSDLKPSKVEVSVM